MARRKVDSAMSGSILNTLIILFLCFFSIPIPECWEESSEIFYFHRKDTQALSVIQSLTIGNFGEALVESSPNQVKITAVSHGVHRKKRNRDVRLNPTAPAGDKSRISSARKKLRLIENIVEDVRDNSRPSGVRKKLRLGLISDIVSRHVQEDSKARKTCKGGKDFKHRKNVKLSSSLFFPL